MATITHKGKTIQTSGSLPAVGSRAPGFTLTRGDLSDATLGDFAGKTIILNIVPSLDTSVCALSAKRFESEAGKLVNVAILTVSRDLPFAQGRFCKAEGITAVVPLSEMRDLSFGEAYGVRIADGLLAGLLARAIVVIDRSGVVAYVEQVPEIGQEPDYERALAATRAAAARAAAAV
ncbi:MAG: thiol peroxidase, partial [Spirochaetaceae bacterium]|nr:thiol peroxidase [Spirochaetaceae bacterium]